MIPLKAAQSIVKNFCMACLLAFLFSESDSKMHLFLPVLSLMEIAIIKVVILMYHSLALSKISSNKNC